MGAPSASVAVDGISPPSGPPQHMGRRQEPAKRIDRGQVGRGFRRYLLQTSTASDTVSDMKITQRLERATISTGVTGRRGGSCMLDGETGHTPNATLADA